MHLPTKRAFLSTSSIEEMKKHKLCGFEIRNVDGVNVSEISDRKAKQVKAKLDRAGLETYAIGSPIGKIDIDKDDFLLHTEKFKRTLEIASILEAENIRLFSFYVSKDANDKKDEVLERLFKFSEIAKGSGVILCHENEKGIYGSEPLCCLEIHKALLNIKAVFDPANFIQCGVDTLKAWEILSPYVKYLHIKDARKDGAVVPAGFGEGNVKKIIQDFALQGGECVTIEPHLEVFEGFSNMEKDDAKSKIGEIFQYNSKEEAFAVAVEAFRKLKEEL